MNQKPTIDSIFKKQLAQMDQPGADENWQRLEKALLAQQQKKRLAVWLLGLLLLLGGSTAVIWGLKDTKKQAGATAANMSEVKPATGKPTNHLPMASNAAPTNGSANPPDIANSAPANGHTNTSTSQGNLLSINRKARQTITLSGGDVATQEGAAGKRPRINKKGSQKISIQNGTATMVLDEPAAAETALNKPVDPTTVQTALTATVTPAPPTDEQAANKKQSPTEPVAENQKEKNPDPAQKDKKDKKKRLSGLQLELVAGMDISNGLSEAGKYGMAMLRIPLNRKANLLLGGGYSNNSMAEGYKQADKPNLLNREVDARLRGLSMLQFPILYEQAIKENKLLFRAGITPVYVLDANIVNVPNSFSGNPGNFRTFTLNDINRFNVLFTAGLQLRLTQRLGLELKGNYGLTELVKNSYINQSGENNNFKTAQVGLLFMIGRKKR